MKNHYYADGVENIALQGGLIRIDYFQYEPAADAEAPPVHQVNDRLVMPPLAFVQAYQAMTSMIQRMEEEGIITRQTPAQASPQPLTPDKESLPTPPSSPNFS